MNRFLALLTRRRTPFPIPYRTVNARALTEAAANRSGVLYCSAHVPLVKVAARAIVEAGLPITACIAKEPDKDEHIALWGIRERIPAIRSNAMVLVRARTVLRSGGSILLLLDPEPGKPYSPNMLRLAAQTGSRIVFFLAELTPSGEIEARFLQPPDPFCSTEAGIQANLEMLDREVRRILHAAQPYEAPTLAIPSSSSGSAPAKK